MSGLETSTRVELVVVVGENPEVQLPHWYVQRDNNGRDGQWHFRPRVSFQRVFAFLTKKLFHSESKLDPEGPAYQKMKNSKKFDPKRSSVLMVLNAQVSHNGKKNEQSVTNISDVLIPRGIWC